MRRSLLTAVIAGLGLAAAAVVPAATADAATRPATVTISFFSNIAPTNVMVNGTSHVFDGKPAGYGTTDVQVPAGDVRIAVDPKVEWPNLKLCHRFVGWSDGSMSASRTVRVGGGELFVAYYTRGC